MTVSEQPSAAAASSASRWTERRWVTIVVRVSWVLMGVLLAGSLYAFLVADGGLARLGFTFLSARWANPLWRCWDVAALWLTTLHLGQGLRATLADYASLPRTRSAVRLLILVLSVVVLAVGSYAIVTFDPTLQ